MSKVVPGAPVSAEVQVGRTSEGAPHLYPAYKDSGVPWLGQIPAHWGIGPGFSAFREKKVKNTGMVENTVLSLSYGKIVVKPPEKLHGLVPESFETYQIVDPTDIIIRPTDLQNDWNSLRVGLARNRGIITSAYMCLRTIAPTIPEYGYLLLHAYDLMKIFYGMGSGLRQNLDFTDLKRMPVLTPPPDEQRAIARFLDAFDRLTRRYIHAQRRLIALLTEQKQALIQQAVTRGLDPAAPLKDSGIEWLGEIPAHWEVKKIRLGVDILRGRFSHRPRNDPSLYDGPYPFIQTGDVAQADKFVTKYSQTLNEKGLQVSRMFPSGTLLMTIAANIGDLAILGFEACFPDSIVGFFPSSDLHIEYLFYLFSSMKSQFLKTAPVNTQANLNVARIGSMPLLMPPLEEQLQIADYLQAKCAHITALVARTQRQIALVREYRTRLIADVVTGKLDVRGCQVGRTSESAPHLEDEADFIEAAEDALEIAPDEEVLDE